MPSPHQRSVDQLDPTKTVLEFFKDTYPNDIATGWVDGALACPDVGSIALG